MAPLLQRNSRCFLVFTAACLLVLGVLGVPGAWAISTELLFAPTGEAASDRLGQSVAMAGDVNGDGYSDVIVGASLNSAAATFAGRAYVYFGGAEADTTADLILTGEASFDYFGQAVGSAGDVNGDGYDDFIVAAPFYDGGGTNMGRVYLYYGGATPDATADLILTGSASGDNLGQSVGAAGDVNRDGFDDFIVGAWNNDTGGTDAGQAYVYFGGLSVDATPDLTLTGETSGDGFGYSAGTAGDVNGDGYDDVIVGAPGNDAGATGAGRAYVYYGGTGADALADLIFTGQAANDSFGHSVGAAGDINGDGYGDCVVGANLNDGGGVDGGRTYVFFGGANADSSADLTMTGMAASDQFGLSVGPGGDVNGDGFDDLLVGAPFAGNVGIDRGLCYVYFGGIAVDTTADLILSGEADQDYFGYDVGSAGDVDGDGRDDIVVGAYGNDVGGLISGRAYVVSAFPYRLVSPGGGEHWVAGQPATVRWTGHDVADVSVSTDSGATWTTVATSVGGNPRNTLSILAPAALTEYGRVRVVYSGQAATPATSDICAAVFTIIPPGRPVAYQLAFAPTGEAASDDLGWSVDGGGDLNGDGFDDIIVGALQNDAGGTDAGRAYVFYGGPAADTASDLVLTGETAGDTFGCAVGAGGDVNGDGYDDVIVGAKSNGAGGAYAGRAYVYYGGAVGDTTADLTLTGEASNNRFGYSVDLAGDVNGDGYEDMIVGADRNAAGGPDAGRAYVFYGGPAADNVSDLILTGNANLGYFGFAVSRAGDVNGDGYGDVIVGAYGNSTSGPSWAGRAYVFYGGSQPDATADLTFMGEAANDNLGTSVGGGGDVNGDGYDDVVAGAPNNDAAGNNAGRAYVYFGGPLADSFPDVVLSGEIDFDSFGISVNVAKDVNGDGFSDVVVGAYAHDGTGNNAGRAYVFFGGPTMDAIPDFTVDGEATGDLFGSAVAPAGDVTGDGFSDVLVGAPGNSAGGSFAGRAYVYDCNRYFLALPAAGATWNVGATETVSWSGAAPADLWLSVDGGNSYGLFQSNVGGSAANALSLLVPHQPTRFARLRLAPHDAAVTGSATTDSLFTIQASITLLNLLVAPVDGGGVLLSWETDPGPEDLMGYKVERGVGGSEQWRVLNGLVRKTEYMDPTGTPASRYRLTAVNGLGEELVLGEASLTPAAALAAWPRPYRGGMMQVSFMTAGGLGGAQAPGEVSLFDINGRLVRRIAQGSYEAGTQTAVWDGLDALGEPVANGVYFLRAVSAGKTTHLKVVVSR